MTIQITIICILHYKNGHSTWGETNKQISLCCDLLLFTVYVSYGFVLTLILLGQFSGFKPSSVKTKKKYTESFIICNISRHLELQMNEKY